MKVHTLTLEERSGVPTKPPNGRVTLWVKSDGTVHAVDDAGTDTDLSEAGGGGAVSSVFGRTGAVVAVSGDYEASEVTFLPTGSISSTTVQAAIAEVSADADAAIPNSLIDAKGDLVTATGSDAPARLPVGSNGQFLVADASTSTGLAWMSVAFAAALVGVDILRGLDVVMGEQPQTALAITGSLSTVT